MAVRNTERNLTMTTQDKLDTLNDSDVDLIMANLRCSIDCMEESTTDEEFTHNLEDAIREASDLVDELKKVQKDVAAEV